MKTPDELFEELKKEVQKKVPPGAYARRDARYYYIARKAEEFVEAMLTSPGTSDYYGPLEWIIVTQDCLDGG